MDELMVENLQLKMQIIQMQMQGLQMEYARLAEQLREGQIPKERGEPLKGEVYINQDHVKYD